MGCLGNLLWFIFGGFISGLSWTLAGCLWCITVIGIPVGMQCFKMAGLSFFPFGKEVVYGGGAGSLLLNIIWLIVSYSAGSDALWHNRALLILRAFRCTITHITL